LPPTPLPPPEEVASWLRENAISFDTASARSGCEDLQPLLRVVGDARVVALGEASHGNSEFFTMKHRLVECLVTEKGFNVFAMEAPWAESNRVNEYIQTGEGNPGRLLAGLHYWVWNTDEVLDLILWLREYNQQRGERPAVSFRGFDMQMPHLAYENLLAYLTAVDPAGRDAVESELSCLVEHGLGPKAYERYPRLTPFQHSRCQEGLQNSYDLLTARRAEYETADSPSAYADALQSIRSLRQYEQLLREPDDRTNLRDEAMAQNVRWLLDQAGEDARIIVWAHNGHVQMTPPLALSTPERAGGHELFVPMGVHLREWYGEELVTVGFSFARGTVRAYRLSASGRSAAVVENRLDDLPPANHEAYLAWLDYPHYFLDLRTIPTDTTVADWFLQQRPLKQVGAALNLEHPPSYTIETVLPAAFDVLIHFQETTPSSRR